MPTLAIPATEPTAHRAGDTLAWRRTVADYPATDGWALAYTLVSIAAVKITIAATASGADYLVSVPAATTSAWPAGPRTWVARVTKGADVHTVGTGTLNVLPDLTAATTYDGRSHARKMLDAIDAALINAATAGQLDVLEADFNTRRIKYDRAGLIKMRNLYTIEVAREETAAGQGVGRGRVMLRM